MIPTRIIGEGFCLYIQTILWGNNLCFYAEGLTNNPGLFLEVACRVSSYERVNSPSVSSQQSQDIFFWRSLVSLVSPLMRQLHMKKLSVTGVALPAIQHHNPQQGSRGALFLFSSLHHTVCPLDADNTFLCLWSYYPPYSLQLFVALNNCSLIAVKQRMPNKHWCCTHPSSICLKSHHLYE